MFRRMTCALAVLALTLPLVAATAVADSGHAMPVTTHPAGSAMSAKIAVTKDPMAGFNLHVKTRGFRWTPNHASTVHRSGEGHAHLFIDGKKVTRLYGSTYYLGTLASGKHVLRVTLNGNDHGDYVRGGKPIAATATVTVPAA
jgi:hypothetical protein